MLKKSIHLGAALILALAFVFTACEGPTGPSGSSGSGWVDPGVVFAAPVTAVTANDLAIAFALSNTVTVDSVTITGAVAVPSGKTLRIAGAPTLSAALTVNNGGTLQVLNNANLTLTVAIPLIVNAGGVAQVLSGGALSISEAAGVVGEAVGLGTAAIRAKYIGGTYTNTGTNADDYGTVTFASGSALVATAAVALTAEAFAITGTVYYSTGVTLTDGILSILDAASGVLYINGNLTWGTNAAKTIGSNSTINVSGNVIQLGGGTQLTVDGELNVAGTYTALNAVVFGSQLIAGSGTVTLGTLAVASTGGNTGFSVNGDDVTVGTVAITGNGANTVTLRVDGTLKVNTAFTVTGAGTDTVVINSSSAGTIVWKVGCVVTEAAAPSTATYGGLPIDTAGTISGSDDSYTWSTSWTS
jgi:hypothetical protein